jgi:hypothetical protein
MELNQWSQLINPKPIDMGNRVQADSAMTARHKTIDIFGKTYVVPPKGLFAGQPGRGPEGKQCRHCEHICRVEMAKVYRKCGLMRKHWTGGKASDIQATAPACQYFQGKAP